MFYKKFAVILLFLIAFATFMKKTEPASVPDVATPVATHSLAVCVAPQPDYTGTIINPGYLTLKMVDMASSLVTDYAYNLSRVLLFMFWI
jgi:hypothetical protein